jgi:hypothetical protein
LEKLAAVEETVVRDKAVVSLSGLCSVLSGAQIEEVYIPAVKRLSMGDWFTSRVSSCGLFAAGYEKCAVSTQEDLRKYALFFALCNRVNRLYRGFSNRVTSLVLRALLDIFFCGCQDFLATLP